MTRATSAPPVSLAQAIETFARGFCFTRSRTHPYLADRVGRMWVMRDAPRKREDYRREEWIACGVKPETAHDMARRHTRGRYCICAIRGIDEPADDLREAYRALGYRLGTTEPLMVHDLTRIPRVPEPFSVHRVRTLADAERLARANGHRPLSPEAFARELQTVRRYMACDGDEVIGWTQSITVGRRTWVSSMFVKDAYRRRGIGRSLMARLLRDDRAAGVDASVLLASHTGTHLYNAVGFQQIGELLLYTPLRSA